MKIHLRILSLLLVLWNHVAAADQNWPCWRGPNANSVADGHRLPIRWSQQENVRWSVKLPGWGTSSPVVFGERVYVTSEVTEGATKSLLTLCFDRENGKELWRHDFGFGVNQRTNKKSNLAVNTPAVTEDAVFVAFGNADIARYSHDGKLIWVTRYIPKFGDPKMAWGCPDGQRRAGLSRRQNRPGAISGATRRRVQLLADCQRRAHLCQQQRRNNVRCAGGKRVQVAGHQRVGRKNHSLSSGFGNTTP